MNILFRITVGIVLLSAVVVDVSADSLLTSARRIVDLNPGAGGSYPSNLTVFGNSLFFSAYTLSTGRELWRFDGTRAALVTNINDTVTDVGFGTLVGNDSDPDWLTSFGGFLYFSAFDPRRGGELWRTDGTNSTRVADINPDVNDTVKSNPNSSWPSQLTALNGGLYFSATTGTTPNYELWKTDGTNVSLVANIHPDSGSNYSSFPKSLTAFNRSLYFMADDGTNGFELWKHDGTSTVLLTNLNPGDASSSSFPKNFTPFNNELYFQAVSDAVGYELWKTDGTNVSLVADINAGPGSSFPEFLTPFKNALYFRATDGINGFELWKYDGSGAVMVTNINAAGDSYPKNLTVFQDALYFSADDGVHGWELWKYDGTSASLVADLNPGGDSFPDLLTVVGNNLFFVATNAATGYELWRCDGTNVTLAADINPGGGSSFPKYLKAFNGQLFFSATQDGISDWELWTLDTATLAITSVARSSSDIRISWAGLGGVTNVIQSSTAVRGPYGNLSGPILLMGTGLVITNYVDINATSQTASRFYRIINQ